jgi:hypothetical protein
LRSSMSRLIPMKQSTVPSLARNGSTRLRNQRYTPFASRYAGLDAESKPGIGRNCVESGSQLCLKRLIHTLCSSSIVQHFTIGQMLSRRRRGNLFRFSKLRRTSNCQCGRHQDSCRRRESSWARSLGNALEPRRRCDPASRVSRFLEQSKIADANLPVLVAGKKEYAKLKPAS